MSCGVVRSSGRTVAFSSAGWARIRPASSAVEIAPMKSSLAPVDSSANFSSVQMSGLSVRIRAKSASSFGTKLHGQGARSGWREGGDQRESSRVCP